MTKAMLLMIVCFSTAYAWKTENIDPQKTAVDLSLINDVAYDLSKSVFAVKPTLGRGLRDMQNSTGGSACTSCAH